MSAPPTSPVTVTLGGSGGASSSGGPVNVTRTGSASTLADSSTALIFQSIGAGGGASVHAGASALEVTIGGSAGASGSGGAVRLTNDGQVWTEGARSHGVFLQSVGGGGGAVFTDAESISVIASSANSGAGGSIAFVQNGDIVTKGAQTFGVFAQSVGGGGGFVDGAPAEGPGAGSFKGSAGGAGSGGAVTITIDGSVHTSGDRSIGVFAQSAGASGGDISISLENVGAMVRGGSAGVGVVFDGGAANTLINRGEVTTADVIDGLAIQGGNGSEVIQNFGLVAGSVHLGGGANAFNNKAGAVLLSGETAYIGANNRLLNDGVFLPASWERIITTNLTGDFVQSATGYLGVDLDIETLAADRVTGQGAANIAGVVGVNLLDPLTKAAKARSGVHDIVIVSATAGATRGSIELQAPQTAVATYSLASPNPNEIVLRHVINYSPAALTSRNQHSVGEAVNRIQFGQVSPLFEPIATSLFFIPDGKTLGAVYNSLSGAGASGAQQNSFAAQDSFGSLIARQSESWRSGDADANSVTLAGSQVLSYAGQAVETQSKGPFGGIAPGSLALAGSSGLLERTWRFWASGYGGENRTRGDPAIGSASSRHSGGGFAAGVDYQYSPGVLLGAAVGGGAYKFAARESGTYGNSNVVNVALFATVKRDAFFLASSLSMSFSGNNVTRVAAAPSVLLPQPGGGSIATTAFHERLFSDYASVMFSGSFEAGYRIATSAIEMTPFVGVQFGSLVADRYTERTESGPSLIGLTYERRATVSVPTFVGLQLKGETTFEWGWTLSAWARAAWKHEWRDERSVEAGFISAPGYTFVVSGSQPDKDALRASAGLKLQVDRNVSFFAGFSGDFASAGTGYIGTAGLKVAW